MLPGQVGVSPERPISCNCPQQHGSAMGVSKDRLLLDEALRVVWLSGSRNWSSPQLMRPGTVMASNSWMHCLVNITSCLYVACCCPSPFLLIMFLLFHNLHKLHKFLIENMVQHNETKGILGSDTLILRLHIGHKVVAETNRWSANWNRWESFSQVVRWGVSYSGYPPAIVWSVFVQHFSLLKWH